MRLLFINPNTSADLTEQGARIARAVARPETEIVPATGRFGARYITTRAAAAIAGHAALDTFAREGKGADAVVIACFGDPGLFALRELSPVPVVGMAEASCHLAATLGRKFSIVSGGHRWGPMLEEFVAAIGLAANLAAVRTISPSGGEITANPDGVLDVLAEACVETVRRDGADAVILGGLAFAGMAERIAGKVPVPLIDNVVAAVRLAEAAASLGVAKPKSGSFSPTAAIRTSGLSAELAALIEGEKK